MLIWRPVLHNLLQERHLSIHLTILLSLKGQATVAMEMLQQQPDLDTIVVPAGGGGLLAGTALAVKTIRPTVKVIGVQAENAPAIVSKFHDTKNGMVPFLPDPCGRHSCQRSGKVTMDIIENYVDGMITVTEQEIASANLVMLEREKTSLKVQQELQ